jgi:hypothetical protein
LLEESDEDPKLEFLLQAFSICAQNHIFIDTMIEDKKLEVQRFVNIIL